jgi:hypothetical protein
MDFSLKNMFFFEQNEKVIFFNKNFFTLSTNLLFKNNFFFFRIKLLAKYSIGNLFVKEMGALIYTILL